MAKPFKFRVLLLGGGTGGHIFPLVAVGKTLKEYCVKNQIDLDLRYFGQPGPYEFYLETHGIAISKVAVSKLRRYFSLLNFLDFFKFFFGYFQAIWKLFWFMPDVVFSKGGPGVLPIIFAARFYNIPIVVHESDAVPGLTTRTSAKRAEIIDVAFEQAKKYFPTHPNVRVTGVPVRDSLSTGDSRAESRLSLGLLDAKPTILILGGSQGAQNLNYFFLENCQLILSKYEVIHQIGRENFVGFQQEYEFMTKNFPIDLKKNYLPFAFLDDEKLAMAINAADVIISRAGAGSISELSAFGKPAILVPLPDSANDHQRENAYTYAQAGGAIVIEENNLLPNVFVTQVDKLLQNKQIYDRMSESARRFYKSDSAQLIAQDIIEASHILRYYSA